MWVSDVVSVHIKISAIVDATFSEVHNTRGMRMIVC